MVRGEVSLKVGLDIGSTTIKCAVIDENNEIIYKSYQRHYSKIIEKTVDILRDLKEKSTVLLTVKLQYLALRPWDYASFAA